MRYMKNLFILAVAIMALAAAGCGPSSDRPPKNEAISFVLSTEPASLDPQMTTGLPENNAEVELFEGLTRLDEKGTPQPALAESWEISPDGLSYIFHIRHDLKWSDGTPLNAQDFVYSWLHILDPDVASSNAYMLFNIDNAEDYNGEKAEPDSVGIKALDDYTLQVKLSDPAVYFLNLTAFHALYPIPRHIVENAPDTWASNGKTVVGCGPYKLVKWVHSSEILMEKNENYWNPDAVKTKYIRMPISESASTRLTMLESGIADMILDPPSADEKRLEEAGLYKVSPMLTVTYYEFNVEAPPFDNQKIREAFSLAIERDELVKNIIRNQKKSALGFVPPGITLNGSDFRESGGDMISENVEKARTLLAEAGYNGEPVTILYNTNETNKAVAEAIQAMWKKNLGVNVELANQETKVFYKTKENGDFQVATANWIADFADPINFLEIFKEKDNDSQYHNDDFNRLIELSKKELNPIKRAEYLHMAEAKLFADSVIVPIYFGNQPMVVVPSLKGYICSPMGLVDLIYSYKEK